MTNADEGRKHTQATAAMRAMGATLCVAGTAVWLATSWVVLAVAGWGVADSNDPLTWLEWSLIIVLFTVPPATLGLLGTMSLTGRRPGYMGTRIATALAIGCGAYAIWWLVEAR